MRRRPSARRDQAHLVTEARQSRSAEINQRERRYLLMMGIRLVCFVVTVVMFVNHGGWLTVIPAAGAIALPYFAVVVANSKRPAGSDGFRAYEPNLPARYAAPNGTAQGGAGGQPDATGKPGPTDSGARPDGGARPDRGARPDGDSRPDSAAS